MCFSADISSLVLGCRRLVVAQYKEMDAAAFANGFNVRNSATPPFPNFDTVILNEKSGSLLK
jgi:hypothetical protein